MVLTSCSGSDAIDTQTIDTTSYGFGRNGTPDDIWAARDTAPERAAEDSVVSDIRSPQDLGPGEPNDIRISIDAIKETDNGRRRQDDASNSAIDTTAALCGNGTIDPGELCDFGLDGSCPNECIDPPGCTATILEGKASECSAKCVTIFVDEFVDGDACCPPGGTPATDSDCNLCGNGTLDSGETCDNTSPSPCLAANDCPGDSGCDSWILVGSAETCDTECVVIQTTETTDGDGCCPNGVTGDEDTDCIATCGDGLLASTEACEPSLPISGSCNDFGYSGGSLSCLQDCSLSTLSCAGGHMLVYEKISNIYLVGDIAHVAWHGSGEWALLVGADGSLARYDATSGAILTLSSLEGTPRDVGESIDGLTILIAGKSNDDPKVWRISEDNTGAVVVATLDLSFAGEEATCVVADPSGTEWAICTRAQNAGGYINRVYRITIDESLVDTTAYPSGSGISDVMWTTTAYPGSNALITSEGFNGAGSQSWVLASNLIVSNGWSPGFGNAGRAEWRPNGTYGIVVGTSTNSVYVFDSDWKSTKMPSPNNGASGNAIAWRKDGSRALVVSRPTGLPLQGSVFDHRPGGNVDYDATTWTNVSIPAFGDAPYNGSFNTHLLDVAWRPNSLCDEGLIVGADNGSSFSPEFGLIVRFYDEDDPDCL